MTADAHATAMAATLAADEEQFWADLMPLAAEMVVAAQRATPAMLQRKLRVGWVLAGDLLLELHELGVVGPQQPDESRPVLAGPDGLADVLAEIARIAASDDQDQPGQVPGVVVAPASQGGLVSLVKTRQPPASHPPATRQAATPGGQVAIRQPPDLAPATLRRPARQVVHATLRQAASHPRVAKAGAVAKQLPGAPLRLVARSPRGGKRLAGRLVSYLRDDQTVELLAKHAEAAADAYTKASEERRARLVERRWRVGLVAVPLVMVGLAWWAPGVLAWLAGLGVFATVASVAPRKSVEGWLSWLLSATVAGVLAWWGTPKLAALVPQPPWWAWWVAGGVAVLACGLAGRKDDQPPVVVFPTGTAIEPPARPTAEMVIAALVAAVPGITDKNADQIRVHAPGVARAQHGFFLSLELPPGSTVSDVMENRESLAAALRRQLGCVWPAKGPRHPGHMHLFIGDEPMATAPQSAWTVAEGKTLDIFDRLPLFTDQEGDWVPQRLMYTAWVVGGAPGYGKSFGLRAVGVAVAFDPRTRIYVLDGKANGDMRPFRAVAHGYYEDDDDEGIAEQLLAVQQIREEMRRRAKFLRDLPAAENPEDKVTSALVDRYPHLAPIFVLLDEVQVYTEHSDKDMRQAFITTLADLVRRGRSAGIVPVFCTQKPSADVLPTAIADNCSMRLCFRVNGQRANDAVLGNEMHSGGIKATKFGPDDKGLGWLKGDGAEPIVVRTPFGMDKPTSEALLARARALREARGLLTGHAAGDRSDEAEIVYDIVQDAERVMVEHGVDKAQWEPLVRWLQELRGQYASLTEDQLSTSIRAAGVEVKDVRSGNSVRKGVLLSHLQKRRRDDAA